jgi:hypothetical protein
MSPCYGPVQAADSGSKSGIRRRCTGLRKRPRTTGGRSRRSMTSALPPAARPVVLPPARRRADRCPPLPDPARRRRRACRRDPLLARPDRRRGRAASGARRRPPHPPGRRPGRASDQRKPGRGAASGLGTGDAGRRRALLRPLRLQETGRGRDAAPHQPRPRPGPGAEGRGLEGRHRAWSRKRPDRDCVRAMAVPISCGMDQNLPAVITPDLVHEIAALARRYASARTGR